MDTNNKIIVGLIIVTISASAGLVWHLFRGNLNPSGLRAQTGPLLEKFSESTAAGTVSERPGSGPARLSAISAVSAVLSEDKKSVLYYERGTGRAFSIGLSSHSPSTLSDAVLPHFIESVWSPSRREVMSTFSTSSGVRLTYYSYATDKATPLPAGIVSAAFSPNGTAIAYAANGNETGGIYLADRLGKNPKQIMATRARDIRVLWSAPDVISLTIPGDDPDTAALFALSPHGDLTRISDAQTHLESAWSPDGERVLVSYFDGDGRLAAAVATKTGDTVATLERGVFASKCALSVDGGAIICGAAQDASAPLSGDTEYALAESLVVINSATGTIEPWAVIPRGQTFSIQTLLLAPLEDAAIIINASDHRLYRVVR